MKIDVLSPRATRAKLSPGRVRLAWRCTGPGGAHQVDRFEVRVLSLERRRMRLPDDARAFSAAHFFQWLLDRTGPHGTVTSRTEVVTVPEISLDLGPDRIHACRISAPSSPEIQAAVVVFFTKPIRNYLRARLERRRPREGDAPRPAAPLVPLLCLELDRHMHVPPGEHDAVDRAFDEVIAAHEAKLGGREGILRLLDALHDIPRATLAAVYGPVPEGREDVAWRDRVAPGAGASLTSLLRRGASPPAARAALPPALTDRLYTAAVSRIQCVDEGDPEWWGEDPIEVVTCWGTRVAVGALPVEIVAHKSFSRGTVEELREARRVFGPRPVEGYLGLGVAVIELDELGVIDDLAALFCALLPAVLGGASERSDGALLVDRGELGAAPLVFEQLEDAIADVYAGLGKEVLLQGTEIFGDLSRGSQQRDLSMSTKEHAYTVTLSVSAVESEGRASG